MDFIKITSETYEEWNKIYGGKLTIRYWINNEGVYWYAYDDVCAILEFGAQISHKLYNKIINEHEKCTTRDDNEYNYHGERQEVIRDWITSDAIRRLIQRNNERNNLLIKTINNLEVVCDSHDLYEEDEDLVAKIKATVQAANARDYEVYYHLLNEQCKSNTCRDVLHKLGVINKYNEEIVDEFRKDLYDPYCEEIEWCVVTKKPETPDEEQRRILYKKHREEGKESTCPSWLKDCLR